MKVESAEFVKSARASGDFVRDGRPEIAFVGRSNVGKSSLLNRLLGRKGLARVSSTPGRTRLVNYFLVNRRFWFVDLPGYGYAKAGKDERREWAALADSYFRDERTRPLVVMLVDGKVGATPLDAQAYEYLASLGVELVVVATKVDRLPRGKRAAMEKGIRAALDPLSPDTGERDGERGDGINRGIDIIPVSAHSGEGIQELWSAVARHLEQSAQ
ncbi:MAG TPA: ribosome biogenesis GTP-binding protein YihA/YsxC [Thermoanaerobaculia bacterium]|nr:ribosome biogenesis GTP-binding protein YihA/YsxC [Thermoanaerobaculia bacterium]